MKKSFCVENNLSTSPATLEGITLKSDSPKSLQPMKTVSSPSAASGTDSSDEAAMAPMAPAALAATAPQNLKPDLWPVYGDIQPDLWSCMSIH